ncbi:GNAT family N-acetyltransferase [Citrobacter sp. NCU1]|uniref:GNAT family N-acetyltransferase n=1 Tax=Citrobacter sp. NCU1 TaxID=2026683 RepID=UPI001390785D|nr:GNAT family N-acetyltransferase [Citrobacter sp. NCU1]NDO83343.1 GNAT family N-acetyltransferase [Citrobacter sp. NCU1]
MTTDVHIREYHPDDFDALCEIFLRAITETASRDYSPEQIAAWAQIDEIAWRQKLLQSETLVAVCQQKVAGFITVRHDYIDLLFVSPGVQRMGIATRLLQNLERRHPDTAFWVEASITAKPLFLEQGYQSVKEQQVEARGMMFTNFVMRKAVM